VGLSHVLAARAALDSGNLGHTGCVAERDAIKR
jgi:hypothetical protein